MKFISKFMVKCFVIGLLLFSRSVSMESSGNNESMLQNFVNIRSELVDVCKACASNITKNSITRDDIVDYVYSNTMFVFKNTTKIRKCNVLYFIDLCIGLRIISLLNQVIDSRSFELNAFNDYLVSTKTPQTVNSNFKKWNDKQKNGYAALKEILEIREKFPKILKECGVNTQINLKNGKIDNSLAKHIELIKAEAVQSNNGIEEIKGDNMIELFKDWNIINNSFLYDTFHSMSAAQSERVKKISDALSGNVALISTELVENSKYKMRLPKNLEKDIEFMIGYEKIICHLIISYDELHSGYVSQNAISASKNNKAKANKMNSEYKNEENAFRKSIHDLYDSMGDVDPNLQKKYMSSGDKSVIGNRQTIIL